MVGFSPFSRRDVLKGAAAVLVAAAGGSVLPGAAAAKAKQSGKQAPGWFRFRLGKFEITMISDGSAPVPVARLAKGVPDAELKAALSANYLDTDTHLGHLNLCLINTGDRLVLIDAGAGADLAPTAGSAIANFKAAGIAPEDVDDIIITHAHPANIWGIIDDKDKLPRYALASYHIDETEWTFWTDPLRNKDLPKKLAGYAPGAINNLSPVSGKIQRIEPGKEIFPGITPIATRGHTPGHMSVLVESEGEKMLVAGGAVSHAIVSFEHPQWQPDMDMNGDEAAKTRKQLLDMALKDRMIVAGHHLPFPGVGRVMRKGAAYRWVPVEWRWKL